MTQGSTQEKGKEQDYYNRMFAERGRFDQFQRAIYETLASEVKALAKGTSVVELGCGSGLQAMCLADEGFTVFPCDLSFQATKVARETARSLNRDLPVTNADAEALPVRSNSMDAALCGLLLHHFLDFSKVAAEVRRVIKPGAVVVAVDANGYNPFSHLFFNVVHRIRRIGLLTENQRAIRGAEIRRVFGALGFVDFKFYSLTSDLKRDWLPKGVAMSLNHFTRALVLKLSRLVLPQVAQGNMLVAVFRLPEESPAE